MARSENNPGLGDGDRHHRVEADHGRGKRRRLVDDQDRLVGARLGVRMSAEVGRLPRSLVLKAVAVEELPGRDRTRQVRVDLEDDLERRRARRRRRLQVDQRRGARADRDRRARQESDRLLAMVNDLLDLTRIEQGRVRLELKSIPAAELVRDTVERFESRATDLGITLKGHTTADLPIVEVDPYRVEHVFANLVANALEHTPRGGEVSISATSEGQDVQFQVTDTGKGIKPEYLPRIFEKFYRRWRLPGIFGRQEAAWRGGIDGESVRVFHKSKLSF